MKIIKGDLLQLARDGHFHVIVHGCNCFHNMGAGIAKQIKEEYPDAYLQDLKTIRGCRDKIGDFTVMMTKQFNIVNAYTQYRISHGEDVFEYDGFQKILDSLLDYYPTCNFGFPLIGCGLANGNKDRIIGMLDDFSEKIERTGGSATLVIFSPSPKTL